MVNRSDDRRDGDPLEPVLRDAEAELKRRLTEACAAEASGIENETTAAIRRLEDSLLSAAVAAEQAITLRRHIAERKTDTDHAAMTQSEKLEPNETTPISGVREFRDESGQLWRAWPVVPGQARAKGSPQRYLGEFHKGWICFESLDNPIRRRLPQHPADWAELHDSQLVRLLDQAITAPERKRRDEAAQPPSSVQ